MFFPPSAERLTGKPHANSLFPETEQYLCVRVGGVVSRPAVSSPRESGQ